MTDYLKDDEALDDEIRSMYGLEKDAPESEENDDDESTDNESIEAEESVDDAGTESSEVVEEAPEPTVAESRYKNAVSAMHKAQTELDNMRKAEGQRDAIIQQLQEQIKELQESQSKQPPTPENVAVDEDDLREARELYPEVVDPLFKIIKGLQDELKNVKGEVGNVKSFSDRYQQQEQQSAADKHWATILQSHPDVQEIASTPEYAQWYEEQPPMIKQALASGTAADVVAALDRYRMYYPKEAVAEAPKTNTRNPTDKLAEAKKAATPSIKGVKTDTSKKTFTTDQIAKMSMDEYAKYEDAIDEAMRAGELS